MIIEINGVTYEIEEDELYSSAYLGPEVLPEDEKERAADKGE